MQNHLVSTFNPDNEPFPGMEMDDHAQNQVERGVKPVADCDVIEHGRVAIAHFERPTELGVYQQLGQSGLSKTQIQENLGAILTAAGPRFACIADAVRLTGLN